jgi:hypothetical protein
MNGTCKEQEENKFDFRQNELGTSIIETKHVSRESEPSESYI